MELRKLVEKHIAVIAGPYIAPLYRMIGAIVFVAHTAEEAAKVLSEIIAREDIGVILVAAEYYSRFSSDLIRSLQAKRPDIIITALPTLQEKGKPIDVERELLRALGIG